MALAISCDVIDKVPDISGCSAGIGKVTAIELARRGARIIMLSRDMKKAEAAAVEIRLNNLPFENGLSINDALRHFLSP